MGILEQALEGLVKQESPYAAFQRGQQLKHKREMDMLDKIRLQGINAQMGINLEKGQALLEDYKATRELKQEAETIAQESTIIDDLAKQGDYAEALDKAISFGSVPEGAVADFEEIQGYKVPVWKDPVTGESGPLGATAQKNLNELRKAKTIAEQQHERAMELAGAKKKPTAADKRLPKPSKQQEDAVLNLFQVKDPEIYEAIMNEDDKATGLPSEVLTRAVEIAGKGNPLTRTHMQQAYDAVRSDPDFAPLFEVEEDGPGLLSKAWDYITGEKEEAVTEEEPTVVERRKLPDGRIIERLSNGNMRIAQ